MHILRSLFIKLLVATAITLIILGVLPFLLNIDQYRPKLLQQVQRSFPGRFDIEKTQLKLIPRPGIELTGFTIEVKNPSGIFTPFLYIPKAQMNLSLKPLVQDGAIIFSVNAQAADIALLKWPGDDWNLEKILNVPYVLNKNINQPPQEGLSWFEKMEISSFHFDQLKLKLITDKTNEMEINNINVSFLKKNWGLSLKMKASESAVGRTLAHCEGRPPKGEDRVTLSIENDLISVTAWQGSDSLTKWVGSIDKTGKTVLEAGNRKIAGILPTLICKE